ncbi:MAG: chromosome partitioning protein ParB, partial [Candidatus Dadabacteria bacterium]
IKEPSAQISLYNKILKEGLSVRAVEQIVSRVVVLKSGSKRKGKKTGAAASGSFPEVTDRLRKALGTKVSIKHHPSGRGRIEIEYFSEQELDRLVDLLS